MFVNPDFILFGCLIEEKKPDALRKIPTNIHVFLLYKLFVKLWIILKYVQSANEFSQMYPNTPLSPVQRLLEFEKLPVIAFILINVFKISKRMK